MTRPEPAESSTVASTRPARRPTAADVARQAGLSRATVSYVLNNTPHQAIPEHTRLRVQAAATELGYSPSPAARALKSGRSEVVLLLLPDWPLGTSIGRTLAHLSAAFAEHGFTFVAHPCAAAQSPSEVWKDITPAAVITFEVLNDLEAAKLQAAGIELTVTLVGDQGRPGTVLVPEQRAGRLQAEHLASVGHRRLGYAWPADERLATFATPRLEGVEQACADLGLEPPMVLTVALDPEAARRAVTSWRDGPVSVTGVCAYNDEVALAVLAGAQRQGLALPRDLAVIGVDDSPFAAVSTPALTTVDTDSAVLAHHIAETVVRKLKGQPVPRHPASNIHAVIRRQSA